MVPYHQAVGAGVGRNVVRTGLVSLLISALVSPAGADQTYVGKLGAMDVGLRLTHEGAVSTGQLSASECRSGQNNLYDVEWTNPVEGTVILVLRQEKRKIGEFRLSKRLYNDGGARIVEWISPPTDFQRRSISLRLARGLDGTTIGFGRRCAEAWHAGQIYVAVRPNDRDAAEAWFRQRDLVWEWNAREPAQTQRFKNLARLTVPVGSELALVREIGLQKWTFEAMRDPVEAGPDHIYVHFPDRTIFNSVADQQDLRRRLLAVLRAKFPTLEIRDDDLISHRRGLSYKFRIKAPMEKLNNRDYRGYWIKTEVIFEFTRQENESGKLADHLTIQIPDGWLARWSRDGTPPEGHFDHLQRHLENKYRNFESVAWLQDVIANTIAAAWNGKLN
jgi:hypothetical protein